MGNMTLNAPEEVSAERLLHKFLVGGAFCSFRRRGKYDW